MGCILEKSPIYQRVKKERYVLTAGAVAILIASQHLRHKKNTAPTRHTGHGRKSGQIGNSDRNI